MHYDTLMNRTCTWFLSLGLGLAATALTACSERHEVDLPPEASEIIPQPWNVASPADVGLDESALDALAALVQGHGVVVRDGRLVYSWGDPSRPVDVASACKPVISTLLMFALQEGRVKSIDDPVVKVDPRLKQLPGRKDQRITFRHLASQTSGYGHTETPGAAWAYNDYALAYYYDVLTDLVFQRDGTGLLRNRLAQPLGFQDQFSFHASHAGRLAISTRDFAKLGVFYLQRGRWNDEQILEARYVDLMVSHPVPADLPRTRGEEAPMLPGQRSLGGRGPDGKDLLEEGPGYYSFNWWVNQPDGVAAPLYPALPPDTFVADGHVHRHKLWVIPGYDMVVVWLNTRISGNKELCERATELIRAALAGNQNAYATPAPAP